MASQTLTIQVPEEFVALVGSPAVAAARARQALVIDVLRDGGISQGQAAHLFGLTRWDSLDLMARYRIESGLETAAEMQEEIDHLRRFFASR